MIRARRGKADAWLGGSLGLTGSLSETGGLTGSVGGTGGLTGSPIRCGSFVGGGSAILGGLVGLSGCSWGVGGVGVTGVELGFSGRFSVTLSDFFSTSARWPI